MFKILFLLFLVVPIIEISILIQLSEVIGGWTTILVVILTAYLGAKMVKQQGLQTVQQIQLKSASGQIPGEELFSGVCILISGVLLVTPGILTDVFGFLLLTPVVRKKMAAVLKQKIHLFGAGQAGQFGGQFGSGQFGSGQFGSQFGEQGSPFEFTARNQHQANDDEGGEIYESTDYVDKSSTSEPKTLSELPNNTIEGDFQRKD